LVEPKKLFKFVSLFQKNYFSGEFFLVLAIIAGYLSQIKGRKIQKRYFLKAKIFIYVFREKFKQFLNTIGCKGNFFLAGVQKKLL